MHGESACTLYLFGFAQFLFRSIKLIFILSLLEINYNMKQ